jgi:hypothetical protein
VRRGFAADGREALRDMIEVEDEIEQRCESGEAPE